jgi:hypothetical protein
MCSQTNELIAASIDASGSGSPRVRVDLERERVEIGNARERSRGEIEPDRAVAARQVADAARAAELEQRGAGRHVPAHAEM